MTNKPTVGLERSNGKIVAQIRRLGGSNHLGLVVALLALFVFLSSSSPHFLTTGNLTNILLQGSFVGIIAFGMTFVIIAAEIDISVGAAVALSSALMGVFAINIGLPIAITILIVLAMGTLVGAFAGAMRAIFSVPSFIVTLALFSALRGIGLTLTNAFPITIPSAAFQFLGSGRLLGIPFPALVMVVTFLVFWFLSSKTNFGRSVYAVGGNAEAARLSGISVRRVRILVFSITGLLAAVSGILLSARLGTGNANIAQGLEFEVIAAVIIGGTSLYGGKGSMVGTLLGVLFISTLSNGMILMGISPFAQDIVRGVVVLVAVLVSMDWRAWAKGGESPAIPAWLWSPRARK
jgi:simple sugar transport system permease protein